MRIKNDWSNIIEHEDEWQEWKDQNIYDIPCSMCGDTINNYSHTKYGEPVCQSCEISDPFQDSPVERIAWSE